MGRFSGWLHLPRAVSLVLVLSACVPQVPQGLPQIDGPDTNGIVQRISVSAAKTALGHTPYCGTAKLATSQRPIAKDAYKPSGAYLVGPGDNLKFNIFGEAGMSDITARVDDAGYVQLPMVELFKVDGKTTRQIQADLKEAYKTHLINPWVTVELVEAQSAPLYFLGEFNKPGVKYMTGSMDVLQSLALAEGVNEFAYLPGARLLRNDKVCTVDLNALLRNGDFTQNVWVRPRDVIFAPRKEDMSVYVLGAVGTPSAIPYGTTGRTLLQALSMAGGPKPGTAKLAGIRIVRTLSPTSGELIVFDARKVLTGRGLDLPLEPGDVVFVPDTQLGSWNAAVAEILPSLTLLGGVLTPISLIQSLNNSNN